MSSADFLTSRALSLKGPALTGFNSTAAAKSEYISSFFDEKLSVVLSIPLLTSKKNLELPLKHLMQEVQ